ncbi:MAG TPA: hypothetical protein VFE62_01355 [Gemmataceae bacterium]|nr:hypothetical protein [Gemmataceae bacterium]
MDSIADQCRRSASAREEFLVHRAYVGLAFALSQLNRLGRSCRLMRLHTRHEHSVRTLFRRNPALSKMVLGFAKPAEQLTELADWTDPMVEINLCLLLEFLVFAEYPDCFSGMDREIGQHCLNRALSLSVDSFVRGVIEQAEKLAFFARHTVRIVNKIRNVRDRIVLIELPIGNSIPIRMLERRFRDDGYTVVVLCVSLSRNDSASRGTTRFELLSRLLTQFTFQERDLLLYPDEWCSGVNFKNLCQLIAKVANRLPIRVGFLPIALVSASAHKDARFPHFLRKHEAFVRRAGLDHAEGFFIFPEMGSKFLPKERLFWAERDRLAGYRKMQHLGGMLGLIDDALQILQQDDDALQSGQRLLLEHMATVERCDVPMSYFDRGAFRSVFLESFRDYESLRPAIKEIKHESNEGSAEFPEESLTTLIWEFLEVVGTRPAWLCIKVAQLWARATGETLTTNLGVRDSYPLKDHAPVAHKLDGARRLLHDMLMAKLLEIN